MIDAYQHAENQDWLGFVLTPKAVARMAKVGLPIDERTFYRQIDNSFMHHDCNEDIYAFAYNNGTLNGKNTYLKPMLAMKEEAGPDHCEKYDRTIAFINQHSKNLPGARS